jgi:hypothetical protein
MKVNRTPLGLIRANKKIVAGAAALALVGGITPTLILNTNAYEAANNADDIVFTTVGPYYFTNSGLDLDAIYDDGAEVHIEDTSVADFYMREDEGYIAEGIAVRDSKVQVDFDTVELNLDSLTRESYLSNYDYDGPIWYGYCDTQYACIQGKKVGETNIVIEREGKEDIRIPLKSVELTPKAITVAALGKSISGTGSLKGADDSFLRIRESYRDDGVAIALNGERGYTILSSNDTNSSDGAYAELVWTIGNQTVGGGTMYRFMPIEAKDLVFGSTENEDALIDATAKLFEKIYSDEGAILNDVHNGRDVLGVQLEDGSIVNILGLKSTPRKAESKAPALMVKGEAADRVMVGPRSGFLTELTTEEAIISKAEETRLNSKLPKNTTVVDYENLKATVYRFYRYSGGSKARAVESVLPESDEEYIEKDALAEFTKLGKKATISLEAPEVEPVEAGKTRKWYATYNNNGQIERVDVNYDAETNTFTLKTNVFGNYALGYVDTDNTPATDNKKSDTPKVPDTGIAPEKVVTTAIATFVPLASLAVIAFITREVKKKTSNKLAKKFNHFE